MPGEFARKQPFELTNSNNTDITERLNKIYSEEDSALDPALLIAAIQSLGSENW